MTEQRDKHLATAKADANKARCYEDKWHNLIGFNKDKDGDTDAD